jgi:hypothetical protein
LIEKKVEGNSNFHSEKIEINWKKVEGNSNIPKFDIGI